MAASTNNTVDNSGCLYWLIIPGALFSLCADAVPWTVAHYNPDNLWLVLITVLILINLGTLWLTFYLESAIRKRRVVPPNLGTILVIALIFWFVNLALAYIAYFSICPSCYFG